MSRPIRNNILSFDHDCDAFEHPKFLALRSRYGWEGDGRFWALNGMIARSDGARLDLSRYFVKAGVMQKLGMTETEFDQFIAFLSDPDSCGLIDNEGGILSTDRTQLELQAASRSREFERDRKERTRSVAHKQLSGGNEPDNGGFPAGQQPDNGGFPQRKKGVFRATLPSSPIPSPTLRDNAPSPDRGARALSGRESNSKSERCVECGGKNEKYGHKYTCSQSIAAHLDAVDERGTLDDVPPQKTSAARGGSPPREEAAPGADQPAKQEAPAAEPPPAATVTDDFPDDIPGEPSADLDIF